MLCDNYARIFGSLMLFFSSDLLFPYPP